MRRNSFIGIVIVLSATKVLGAEPLSLEKAKALASQSPRIQMSEAALLSAKNQREASLGLFLPRVTLSQGYSLTNDPVGVFSFKLDQKDFTANDFVISSLNSPDARGQWRTRIEATQPLFRSFASTTTLASASHHFEAQKLRNTFALQRMKLQIVQLYFSTVAFKLRKDIIQEGIERLQRLEKSYELMSAPTATSTTNYLIAQSIRLRLAAELNQQISAMNASQRTLATLLGFTSDTEFTYTDALPPVSKDIPPTEEKRSRGDVAAEREELVASKEGERASFAEWGPHLDAMAGYNLYSKNYARLSDSYDVGVLFTWPLFEGGRRARNSIMSSQVTAQQNNLHALELESRSDLDNASTQMKSIAEQYLFIGQGEEKASEALKIAARRYAEGTMPLFDYSQTIQNWVAARQAAIEAQYGFSVAKARLDFERGAL